MMGSASQVVAMCGRGQQSPLTRMLCDFDLTMTTSPRVNTTSRTSPICYPISGYWKPSAKGAPPGTFWT